MKENSKKVMIIDDNEDIVAILKVMLLMKDYNVIIKMNITDLEGSIKEVMPDLIIMDMLLSGSDGHKICRLLKNDSSFASVPVFNDLRASQSKSRMFKCRSRYVFE